MFFLRLFAFEPMPTTELQQMIVERLNRLGPMTFRDFMQTALYEPELGYYNTEKPKIGPAGDYYTSSNVHPAFGAVLAQAFAEQWAGSDESLTIVEMGPGTGRLAVDVLTTMRDEHPATFDRLNYILVEASPAMRKHQQDKLAVFEGSVSWCSLDQLERAPIRGIVFSNEFVDALPVHRVRLMKGLIEEQYVSAIDSERLGFVWQQPSSERLGEYIDRIGVHLRQGQEVEINIDVLDWLSRMGNAIAGGLLVTIDYGDTAGHLWTADRKSGTLRSFHLHKLTNSVLELVGEQDITSSVNFTALIEYGRDFGFEFVTYERQTAFLTRFGLIERIASRHAPGESLDDLQERLAVKNLFVPGGISDSFRVLIQRR
jgi:SAM-dependent MidA family methyltransferase